MKRMSAQLALDASPEERAIADAYLACAAAFHLVVAKGRAAIPEAQAMISKALTTVERTRGR